MSFTAILGCCCRVLQTAAILKIFTATFCRSVRAAHRLFGVDSLAVQGIPWQSPYIQLCSSLEIGAFLAAGFSAAARFSPLCPWGRVLIWSQVSRQAVSAHREAGKAERWWCPVAHMKHCDRKV